MNTLINERNQRNTFITMLLSFLESHEIDGELTENLKTTFKNAKSESKDMPRKAWLDQKISAELKLVFEKMSENEEIYKNNDYLYLCNQLSKIEESLPGTYEKYNMAVKKYNNYLKKYPQALFPFDFKPAGYYAP